MCCRGQQGPESGSTDDHRPRSSVLASCLTVSYWLSNSCQPNVLLLLWVQFDEFGFLFFPPTITFPSRLQVCLTSDLPSVFPHPSLRSQNIVLSSQSFYYKYLPMCPQNTWLQRAVCRRGFIFIVRCRPHAWGEPEPLTCVRSSPHSPVPH